MENIVRETEPELMYWTPLEQQCAVYRGQIIHYSIKAESLLDEIIAFYFCKPEKRIEFIYGCLNKQFYSLSQKIETLAFILTQKYKLVLKKYPTLNIDFEEFIKIRNDYAHRKFSSYADVNKDNLDGNIFLQHFKTKKNIM